MNSDRSYDLCQYNVINRWSLNISLLQYDDILSLFGIKIWQRKYKQFSQDESNRDRRWQLACEI